MVMNLVWQQEKQNNYIAERLIPCILFISTSIKQGSHNLAQSGPIKNTIMHQTSRIPEKLQNICCQIE